MKILVISPHPDDEAIGCGGSLAQHISNGDTVEVIFLTSGEKGGHGRSAEDTVKTREAESQAAAGILQISSICFWREPDGAFRATEVNTRRLADAIVTDPPGIIYAPHDQEAHPDHKEAAKMVIAAMADLPEEIPKPTVLFYEVWTPLQQFDHIADITDHVDKKREAILAYKSQCDELSFDEAILGLNRYRGEMHSWPGGDYAEVFKKL
ncbi:MAG: PIG-L family deacetylase [Ferruginibacter sp.]